MTIARAITHCGIPGVVNDQLGITQNADLRGQFPSKIAGGA